MSEGRTLILGSLHLDDCAMLDHGLGLNLGTEDPETQHLSAPDVDGDMPTVTRYGNVEAFVPVIITPQPSWDEIVDLYNLLEVELRKPANVLQFGPIGSNELWLYDVCEPASVPSLFHAQVSRQPDSLLFDPVYMPVILRRYPGHRGPSRAI